MGIWFNTIISVLVVSLISLIGIVTLALSGIKLKKIIVFLVSFATGSMFGGAFIHLLPEAAREIGTGLRFSLCTLSGIVIFFVLEKFIHWRHCHIPTSTKHPHPVGMMNLVGDGLHNFIDGMVIAASYSASASLGAATTIAVVLHEIPQEIGDFGILLHAGYTRLKALGLNFLSALLALLGAVAFLVAGSSSLTTLLIPVTAGGFIYIAGSDLIPELKKELCMESCPLLAILLQFLGLVLGIAVMVALA